MNDPKLYQHLENAETLSGIGGASIRGGENSQPGIYQQSNRGMFGSSGMNPSPQRTSNPASYMNHHSGNFNQSYNRYNPHQNYPSITNNLFSPNPYGVDESDKVRYLVIAN